METLSRLEGSEPLHVQLGSQTVIDTLPDELRCLGPEQVEQGHRMLQEDYGMTEGDALELMQELLTTTESVGPAYVNIPQYSPNRPGAQYQAPAAVEKPLSDTFLKVSLAMYVGGSKEECYMQKKEYAVAIRGLEYPTPSFGEDITANTSSRAWEDAKVLQANELFFVVHSSLSMKQLTEYIAAIITSRDQSGIDVGYATMRNQYRYRHLPPVHNILVSQMITNNVLLVTPPKSATMKFVIDDFNHARRYDLYEHIVRLAGNHAQTRQAL